MKELLVELKEVSHYYSNENKVLNNISFKIHKGEEICVIGANGAGKSTMFLHLNGILRPYKGKMYYRGNEIKYNKKDLLELRKNVGIVFQEADSQIIASTVFSEVSFGPINLKLPKIEVIKRVDEALEYMNITDLRDKSPHYLSGGEKKKVSIADIISMKPEIIIFDEPTASLDPINIKNFEKVLKKMKSEGLTILISTHDVDFAYKWAKRVIVFNEGSIIKDDIPINVFKDELILESANLKKPMLLEVYESLIRNKFIKDNNDFPTDIDEFNSITIKNRFIK